MGNPLISRWLKLAGALLLLGAMPSCLLPQEDDPLPDVPPVEDHRPLILLNQLQPGAPMATGQVISTNNCTDIKFRVFVEDEDVSDPISSMWRATPLDGRAPSNYLPGSFEGGQDP